MRSGVRICDGPCAGSRGASFGPPGDRRWGAGEVLLLHLDDGSVMVLHLGMSGRILLLRQPIDGARSEIDHVIFTTEDGGVVRFNDARRFGNLDLTSDERA